MSALYKVHASNEISYRLNGMEPYELHLEGGYHKSKGLGMVLGIVASVATMGAAAPLLAAGGMTALAGGAMMAGGVLTGVGALTGNSKLSKIGGILSLAGGIGAYASGGFSAGASQASQAVGSNEALTNFADASAQAMGGETLGAGLSAAGEGASTAGQMFKTLSDGTVSLATPAMDVAASGAAAGAAGSVTPMIDAATGTVGTVGEAAGTVQSSGGILGNAWDKVKSVGSDVGKFANENKELVKIGGEMLSKGFGPDQQGLIDAQTGYYEANSNGQDLKNEQLQTQMNNMNNMVVMLSEDDPQLEAKKQAAVAAGKQVGIIPKVGSQAGLQYNNNLSAPNSGTVQPAPKA